MEKVQLNVKTILTLILVVIIFLSGILVGSPAKNNVQIIYVLMNVVAILYLVQKARKREKIFQNKMDIFVFLLCLSSCIPILFKTYTSFCDSILFVSKYESIFLAYLIAKETINKNEMAIDCLVYTMLIISVLLVLLGIDRLTTNYFEPLNEILNTTNLYQGEVRLTSFFSYANSLAVTAGFGIFLALGQILKSSKVVIKGLNQAMIVILFSGLILTLSRMMFLMMGFMSLIFILLTREKKARIEIIEIFIVTGILAILQAAVFRKFLASGNDFGIWMSFLCFSIIAFMFSIIFKKINKKLFVIEKQTIVKISIVSSILLLVCLILMVKTPENLILFHTPNAEKKIERHLSNIKGDETYFLTFDLEAKTIDEQDIFQIIVLEKDKYWENIKNTKISFGDYQGKKEIEVHTDSLTTDIYLEFITAYSTENTKLEIKNFEINGKQHYLNYKFLPYDLVSKVENINFKTQSVWERGVYITDALTLAKDNWLFGIGGDGWHYRYGEIQDYNYVAREVHSYPVQILLEFGVVRSGSLFGNSCYGIENWLFD